MRSIVLRGLATAIVALAAACSTADSVAPRMTTASARRSASARAPENANISRQVDRFVWVSCANGGAGEAIHVTGDLRYDVHQTVDATGVIHYNVKSNTSGLTGVGTTSGTFYRGSL